MKKLLRAKKMIIITVASVLVIGIGGVFFAVPMLTGSPMIVVSADAHSPVGGSPTREPEHGSKDATPEPGLMYPLKERIVNLADTGGFHYLKTAVVLEFDLPDARNLKGEAYKKRQEEFGKDLSSRQPKLDDILTTILGTRTAALLNTAEGKEKLREELKTRFAEVVREHKLVNVYFTQFIIQ